MADSRITITMEGDLPDEAFGGDKSRIERRIQDDVIGELGEYEIHGEFFPSGRDVVYALFLRDVVLEEVTDEEDPRDATIEDLEGTVQSLRAQLGELEEELGEYKHKPEKFSLGELDVNYRGLPFCEGCGEKYTDFGVEIREPDGGTDHCLDCFTTMYELCEQDIATIRETCEQKEKAYYQEKLAAASE